MSVNIIWSLTNGSAAISSTVDHANASNGANTTAKQFFIRHDGVNEITDVGLYVREFSSTYTGSATSVADIAELLSWGDDGTVDGFGGFMINMDSTNNFPDAVWPVWNSKSPTNGAVFRTTVGDNAVNAVDITTDTGATATGTIQTGSSPNVSFQCRIEVPENEDTIGYRQFDQVLTYTFTS